MSHKNLITLVVCCIAAALLVYTICNRRFGVVVDEPIPKRAPVVKTLSYDFGHAVTDDSGHRCTFEITNDSNTDLKLSFSASTNYISVDPRRISIPAGESKVIGAEYLIPRGSRSAYRQCADLKANHPRYEVLRFVVTGRTSDAPSTSGSTPP